MILYRSVGLQEMELIYDSGMEAFPARLPQQPIFYPVLQLEYARQTASDWNVKSGQLAGYVTQFKVDDAYISHFEKHTVGGAQHEEFWIPAEEMDEFNRHITGHIKIVEAYFGDAFEGFVPEKFGLQGKDAVAQFTLLTNTYIYKRMDFYLEIRRNHKAIFLNYPFWQKYDFPNAASKKKMLQAVREAWLTSFPKIPLPLLVDEDMTLAKQTYSQSLAQDVSEHTTPVRPADTDSGASLDEEDVVPAAQSDSNFGVNPIREDTSLAEPAASHFSRGLALGFSGKYHEAVDALSKAVGENPKDVVARTTLGVVFHQLGEDDRALSCYEAALKMDPLYAEAHYFRANILYSQGSVREAISGYTTAIGLKPELIEAHQEPVLQDRLTDYSKSPSEMRWISKPARRIIAINNALETNPGQAYLFKDRAAEYFRLRNYVQAISDYDAYLEIEPEDARVLHLQGLAYEEIGQLARAQENYQRAMEINPQLSNEYINRGVTFWKMGQFRQSIASLTESIRLTPQNPDGYFNRAMIYFQQDDVEKAIDDLSNVISFSPGDEVAYYWRGICNEKAGRQRPAIADYRQFLALSQDSSLRHEIEQKLSQWNKEEQNAAGARNVVPTDRQKTDQVSSDASDQDLDLHSLIAALGERALNSTWFGSGVDSYGERAQELRAVSDQNKPIEGRDLISITAGIYRTLEGDFQAFDLGATSPWIFVRAWDGSGFYIETNDPKIKEHLKTYFQSVEDVPGVAHPYEVLFIHI